MQIVFNLIREPRIKISSGKHWSNATIKKPVKIFYLFSRSIFFSFFLATRLLLFQDNSSSWLSNPREQVSLSPLPFSSFNPSCSKKFSFLTFHVSSSLPLAFFLSILSSFFWVHVVDNNNFYECQFTSKLTKIWPFKTLHFRPWVKNTNTSSFIILINTNSWNMSD